MKIKNLAKLGLMFLLIVSFQIVMALDETDTDEVEIPDVLTDEIELWSEDFPELLDLEWVEYVDREITIWLPAEFKHMPVEEMLEYAEAGSSVLDKEFEPYIEMLMQNPDMVRFVAVYSDISSPSHGTNVLIGRERNILNMSGVDMLEAMTSILPDSVEMLREPTELELEGFESVATIQWAIETMVGDMTSLMYVVNTEDYFYILNYTVSAGDNEYHQAIIESALQTLVIDLDFEEA